MGPLRFSPWLNFSEFMEFPFIICLVLRIAIAYIYNKHCRNEKPTA
jgi:hypothetical protein